jgi:predicted PolB exonuclease-like 3'-5' exonuclease
MLPEIDITQILFLDIETVPEVYHFGELDASKQGLWSDKTRFLQERENRSAEEIYEKAGIYAEFGKVICISTAFVYKDANGAPKIRVKSFYGDDEKEVLTEFSKVADKYFSGHERFLCGHNIKEFDVPYMARRMLLKGVKLPDAINTPGKKPWEVRHLDTMELWKFGDYKHFTSLNLLANLFSIPTPKDDISGADVARVYWEEKDLERIKTYCEKDTLAVAHLMHRFKNLPLIPDENIEYV